MFYFCVTEHSILYLTAVVFVGLLLRRRRLCLKFNTFVDLEVCGSNQVHCIPINQKCNNCRLIVLGLGFMREEEEDLDSFFLSSIASRCREKKKNIRSTLYNNTVTRRVAIFFFFRSFFFFI